MILRQIAPATTWELVRNVNSQVPLLDLLNQPFCGWSLTICVLTRKVPPHFPIWGNVSAGFGYLKYALIPDLLKHNLYLKEKKNNQKTNSNKKPTGFRSIALITFLLTNGHSGF